MPSTQKTKEELTPRARLSHIGNWRLGPTLGRGAYGHVRLATHTNGRQAACKILPALRRNSGEPATWDKTVDAVEAHKEIVLLKALSGMKLPGVVELEGIVEKDGWTFIFSTLHSHSAAQYQTPWPHDQVVGFFRRLCLAVHSLHQLNISHEDLKRSNVMVDALGCPALIDFGFSHFAAYGQVVKSAGGTLDYTSPEKAGDQLYDGRVNDVWALGILLVKILGIPHPYINFAVDTESTAKRRLMTGEADFVFKAEHIGSGKAASLILQMLDPDVWQRITIPEILHHPFLRTPQPDPHLIPPPSLDMPSGLYRKLPADVIQDICFLKYLNHDFHLCETFQCVKERLRGREPCWEKRWAKMLYAWRYRDDVDPKDLAQEGTREKHAVHKPILAAPDFRSRLALSNVPPNIQLNIKGRGSTAKPQKGEAKRTHDEMDPSKGHTRTVRADNVATHKRSRRSDAQAVLSDTQVPSRLERIQARVKRVAHSRRPPIPISNGTGNPVPDQTIRVVEQGLLTHPLMLIDEASSSVLARPKPSTLKRLDHGPGTRPHHVPEAMSQGDLIGDSVRVMQDLNIDANPLGWPKQPRRSSRIAEKVAARVIR